MREPSDTDPCALKSDAYAFMRVRCKKCSVKASKTAPWWVDWLLDALHLIGVVAGMALCITAGSFAPFLYVIGASFVVVSVVNYFTVGARCGLKE
ncbi:hypothetical protein [Tahibacter amnicola]|uniref:Uncharacterized protein n=1 Tax=Tahibacter amnicola TaxID=2976241 RepID=A0ABY6BHU9_9GAMM|nr:hypothetical protein [Tahibacter amnicola]UXI67945.1 hypothetical protein N4264_24995 [Tahibacter amnicola]